MWDERVTRMNGRVNEGFVPVNAWSGAVFSGLSLAFTLTALLSPAAAAELVIPGHSPETLIQRVAVFGTDDRKPLPQSYFRLGSKVGVLHDPRTRSVCTAFCVAPTVVAPAAHCLYRTGDETPLRLSDITVRLNGTQMMSHVAGTAADAPE